MTRRLAAFVSLLGLLAGSTGASADDAWAKRVEERAPSLVAVKYVLKTQGGGADREQSGNAAGVIVDPAGVVMMPSWTRRFSRSGVKSVPVNVRVLFDGDEKEYEAIAGATDAKLGLGFVVVKDLAGKKVVSVDFTSSSDPQIGDELYEVARLDQGFDYAPYFGTAKIVGQVTKPRPMWIYHGTGAGHVAHPFYAMDGKVAGLVIVQGGVTEEGTFSHDRPFLLPAKVAAVTIAQGVKASLAALAKSKETEAEEKDKPKDDAAAMSDDAAMDPGAGMDSGGGNGSGGAGKDAPPPGMEGGAE